MHTENTTIRLWLDTYLKEHTEEETEDLLKTHMGRICELVEQKGSMKPSEILKEIFDPEEENFVLEEHESFLLTFVNILLGLEFSSPLSFHFKKNSPLFLCTDQIHQTLLVLKEGCRTFEETGRAAISGGTLMYRGEEHLTVLSLVSGQCHSSPERLLTTYAFFNDDAPEENIEDKIFKAVFLSLGTAEKLPEKKPDPLTWTDAETASYHLSRLLKNDAVSDEGHLFQSFRQFRSDLDFMDICASVL